MFSKIHDLIRDGKAKSKHMVETHPNLYGHIQVGELNLRAHSAEFHHRQKTTTPITPSSQPKTALTSSDTSDFVIAKGDVITRLTLELELKTDENFTATGVDTTLYTVLDCINSFDIYAEGTSTTICTVESADMLVAFADQDRNKYLRAERAICGHPAGSVNADFVASESRTVFINLPRNIIVDNELFSHGIENGFTIRVNWNSKSWLGLQGVSINRVRLLSETYKYDQSIRDRMIANYAAGPRIVFNFMAPAIQRGGAQTIKTNELITIQLTNVSGLMTDMVIIARVKGSALDDSPLYISNVVLKNASNVSELGTYGELSHAYVSDVMNSDLDKYQPDTILPSDAFYRLPISENPHKHAEIGSVGGYIDMDGKHSLEFVCKAATTSDVEVVFTILYSKVATFSVEKGKTAVVYSSK